MQALSHPSAQPPAMATGASWEADVYSFVKGTDSGTPPDVRSQREKLYLALKANPSSPAAWLQFLKHEESILATSTMPLESVNGRGGAVSMVRLYEWATRVIPRLGNEKDETYLQIWLGFARHQVSAPLLPLYDILHIRFSHDPCFVLPSCQTVTHTIEFSPPYCHS